MNYEKQEIFNNNLAVVNYFPEISLVENIWIKKVALDSFSYRESFLFTLEFLKKNKFDLYLSDIREQGAVSVTEKKWFREVVFPEAVKGGVKFASVITGSNPFKNYYMNAIIKVGGSFGMPVKLFSDYEKGVEWLVKLNSK